MIPDIPCESEFRPKSPLRRRSPEKLFYCFEANVSQNYEKWEILAYRHSQPHAIEEFLLHGGDVVRIKHAESGGYITVDEGSQEKNGMKEAYVRVYKGSDASEIMTSNQLFEIEKNTDTI